VSEFGGDDARCCELKERGGRPAGAHKMLQPALPILIKYPPLKLSTQIPPIQKRESNALIVCKNSHEQFNADLPELNIFFVNCLKFESRIEPKKIH
jgi:hypothetical protein